MGFESHQLTIRYGNFTALHDFSLSFGSGALGLLGPNGAGKSSLLRAILGFVPPASGRLTVLGSPLGKDPRALRRRIGYHPEDDVLLPGLNGVAAVALCGELSGLPATDALQRAHEILYFVGLGEVRYRTAETYSQGMRQRLKLAQALVHDPDLLILDEPTNGLDPRGRQEMLELLADLVRNKNMQMILSSHLLPDVEVVCDQVAVLDRGHLVASGSLETLLRGAHRTFDVRLKGPVDAFEELVAADGGTCRRGQRGMLHVEKVSGGSQQLFTMAQQARCQVRHLMPARQTLTEVFQSSVAPGGMHADP